MEVLTTYVNLRYQKQALDVISNHLGNYDLNDSSQLIIHSLECINNNEGTKFKQTNKRAHMD